MTRILVTGGAGFIGSHVVRRLLQSDATCEIVNLDKLTYAGSVDHLEDVTGSARYRFVRGDIADARTVDEAVRGCAVILNVAAETHVDRSILASGSFVTTNVLGTQCLLEAARRHGLARFVQVSTDEVYGSCPTGALAETAPLRPSNPYAATKAAADLLVRSYFETYGLNVVVTRGTNTFGPWQFPEKVIPLFITHALEDRPLPLYGDGGHRRDWLYVEDHCAAIELVLRRGAAGDVYNIGAGQELPNLDLAHRILRLLGKPERLVTFVKDRPGHDRRYALDATKLRALGWAPRSSFDEMLAQTVDWYRDHRAWWEQIKGSWERFQGYYTTQYGDRA